MVVDPNVEGYVRVVGFYLEVAHSAGESFCPKVGDFYFFYPIQVDDKILEVIYAPSLAEDLLWDFSLFWDLEICAELLVDFGVGWNEVETFYYVFPILGIYAIQLLCRIQVIVYLSQDCDHAC